MSLPETELACNTKRALWTFASRRSLSLLGFNSDTYEEPLSICLTDLQLNFLQHTDEILNSKIVLNLESMSNTNYLQHLPANQNLPLALYLLVKSEIGCDPEVTTPTFSSCTVYWMPSVLVDHRKL